MKASSLKDKSVDELQLELVKLRADQFKLLIQNGTGQLGQSHLLKEFRKDVARVKTLLNQKLKS